MLTVETKPKKLQKSWCCNIEQQQKSASQAKLAELKTLGLLPFFKLWSQWGRTVLRLHMDCSLLHWSPGGSLLKAQLKVWYPAPGSFQWDGALSFPFIPLNVFYQLHHWELPGEWGSSSVSMLLRQSCEYGESICSCSLCSFCCPAVSLGHYQIKDQGQGTLEKATSVAKTWRAQFKAPLLKASKTQTGKLQQLKTADDTWWFWDTAWVGKALPFRDGFHLFGRQAHKHNLLEVVLTGLCEAEARESLLGVSSPELSLSWYVEQSRVPQN